MVSLSIWESRSSSICGMRRMLKRRLFWLAVAVLAALSVALYFATRSTEPWFRYLTGEMSSEVYSGLGKGKQWTTRSLDVGGGVSLRAFERKAPGAEDRPVVIFFPGNSDHPFEEGQLFLDQVIDGNDWGGIVVSYRGYVGNPGSPSPGELEADGRRIYDLVARTQPKRPIHLVGHSLGSSILASIVSKPLTPPPASVTFMSSAPSVVMREHRFSARHRYDALEHLGPPKFPVVVIHGERDKTLPVLGGRTVAERLKAPFVGVPNCGHMDLLEHPRAIAAVRRMVAEHTK